MVCSTPSRLSMRDTSAWNSLILQQGEQQQRCCTAYQSQRAGTENRGQPRHWARSRCLLG